MKTYLMQFSEAEGFSHLHVQLVPRLPDHPEDARRPRVIASKDDSGHIVVGGANYGQRSSREHA